MTHYHGGGVTGRSFEILSQWQAPREFLPAKVNGKIWKTLKEGGKIQLHSSTAGTQHLPDLGGTARNDPRERNEAELLKMKQEKDLFLKSLGKVTEVETAQPGPSGTGLRQQGQVPRPWSDPCMGTALPSMNSGAA